MSLEEALAEFDAARAERRALNVEHDTFLASMNERKIANRARYIAAEAAVIAAEQELNPVDPALAQSVEG
jgi:hypothetical protein